MQNTYRVRYSQMGNEEVADRVAVSPVSALNSFHKEMQFSRGVKHADYKVNRLDLVYNADPTGNLRGEWKESPFDLPSSATPDLSIPEPMTRLSDTMEFFDASIGQGRLAQ